MLVVCFCLLLIIFRLFPIFFLSLHIILITYGEDKDIFEVVAQLHLARIYHDAHCGIRVVVHHKAW